MEAVVIIGAHFGDEGKGLFTDYFSDKLGNNLAIRFNGGSQASHTVYNKDGTRHAFSHFSSGSFACSSTYLSSYFISNPIIFAKELKEYTHPLPKIYVDGESIVTTPFDMMINQAVEALKGKKKHGSCGIGINETVNRSMKHPAQQIKVKHLLNIGKVVTSLMWIQKEYLSQRLSELGHSISQAEDVLNVNLLDPRIIESYFYDVAKFIKNIETTEGKRVLHEYDALLFEGAQGLLLDEKRTEYFPHVTRSRTGLTNVAKFIEDVYHIDNLHVVYISRIYVTRHGAGFLPSEREKLSYVQVNDPTNKENEFQGSLRFGVLNVDTMVENIRKDLKTETCVPVAPSIALTCADQAISPIEYILDGAIKKGTVYDLLSDISSRIYLRSAFISFGPTRDKIVEVKL